MKLSEVTKTLAEIAPPELAQDGDNVGLLVGDCKANIRRVLLTIDLTAEVLAEARAEKANLIVAYHPPIWEPLKRITAEQSSGPPIYETIRAGMAVYAMHTALDAAPGGVNDLLAETVGIVNPQPLQCSAWRTANTCKLVVFVPPGDLAKVSEAVFAAGAGEVGSDGKYSKCSFRCRGTGTFQCGANSQPAVGRPGSFEQVDELRLESVVPVDKLGVVVEAMLAAHSYEEVAYDVLPMLSQPAGMGLGRYGEIQQPTGVSKLVQTIKKSLKVKTVGMIGPQRRRVKRAAVCAGSCGSTFREVIAHGCDFYLTGELRHHDALELQHADVTTVCVGHSVSERPILARIAKQLRRTHQNLPVCVSRKDRDPFTWI